MSLRSGEATDYGQTGGLFTEKLNCHAYPFDASGSEISRSIKAAILLVSKIPEANKHQIVLAGFFAGGRGVFVYGEQASEGVIASISFGGGRSVRKDPARRPNCTPEDLIEAVSDYGPYSRVPILWVYSENDKLVNPDIVQKLLGAFEKNGGKAELEFVKPFRNDGHDIFRKSGSHVLWGPPVEKFLKSYVK